MRFSSIERYAQAHNCIAVMAGVENSFYQDMVHGSRYFTYMTEELPAYITRIFPASKRRKDTYIAGFSMGGRETIFITLQRPELFGYVCAISAAPGIVPTKDKFMSHEGQIQEDEMKFAEDAVEPNVFIVCCGTRDSVVGTYPKQYHELLEANGADHIWYEITGADHDNNAIKSGLFNLFKQIAYDKG